MEFTFTSRHKNISIALMVVGAAAIAAGFATGHDTTRSWASLLLGNFFFMALALAAIAFVAIQYVAEVGWSAMIKRIPMAMSTYLPFAGIFMIIIFIAGHHDLYHWTHDGLTDPSSPHFDEKIAGKSAFLNTPFFLVRLVVYFLIWAGFAHLIRKNSIAEDSIGGTSMYFKNRKLSAIFLVLFLVTSSTMAWDIIMSIDPHWFSTLFGWYTFASMWVSALSMMGLILVYLKRKGLMPGMNENHLHDVGKFMFAFSIFWTYLWFAQFMLYWYANLPEEVAYYMPRFGHYRPLFLLNFFVNFITPFLVLMSRDSKRKLNYVLVGSIIILCGHWLDMFLMIMPGTVGSEGSIGYVEIGSTMFFGGVFMFVVLRNLAAAPLVAKNHPMLEEAKHFSI